MSRRVRSYAGRSTTETRRVTEFTFFPVAPFQPGFGALRAVMRMLAEQGDGLIASSGRATTSSLLPVVLAGFVGVQSTRRPPPT